ncbi:MAG TPA: GAF domain-containing sensor histidine kinase [Candidatus Limnocylindria bacterium]|nr:GAF domain-containing sensor histidine kinase [Candidatus Limnocylindria bacterium]
MTAAEPPTRSHAERAEANLAALDAALQGIAGLHPIETVLQLIVDRVRDLVDATYAALGMADAEGRIVRFLTSGISRADRERIGALPRGHGLLGLLIRERASLRIGDIALDARRHGFPAHHPVMHSLLGVPILIGGEVVGDLYLTDKRGAAEFSEEDQRLVERFALHAGIAIETARLNERIHALAVVEERERIGRDLHDGVIQRLYAISLGLDDVSDQIGTDPDVAAARVELAIEALGATMAEIRTFIYGLRPGLPDSDGLPAALRSLADELRLEASVEVVPDGAGTSVDGEIMGDVLQIAREALSNVARHAGVSRVAIRAEQIGDDLRLMVADDGRGFDPDAPLAGTHHGLANIRRRAERIGGQVQVVSGRGAGTRIIVSVPFRT